jgi:serine/tyrosine/threonine adenylyltransferase
MELRFDNAFTRELPADPLRDTRSRLVPGALYSHVTPEPASSPSLVAWVPEVARILDLPTSLDGEARAHLTQVLAGNRVFDGTTPWATRYGGHQFGSWAGQLGDGRALSLGEAITQRHGRQELQLKGAGRTPYSRRADGRAVLRSSLRELVCSEAMHHLGVPTTRALSLVLTGDRITRDMFYDGNPEHEPGAIVCRVAPSFVRFGHFEMPAADGDVELLRSLFAHVVTHHFPGLSADAQDPEAVLAWFHEVGARTVALVTHWQRVGFVHGVMNTDNMSVLGLSIDYGPFGFLEPFEPRWTPNTTDAHGRRYAYANQPRVVLWNLARLAESLLPLVLGPLSAEDAEHRLTDALEKLASCLEAALLSMFARKLGLADDEVNKPVIEGAFKVLEQSRADFTLFFRALSSVATLTPEQSDDAVLACVSDALYGPQESYATERLSWLRELRAAWGRDGVTREARVASMERANPQVVPRNWLLQEAIDALTGGDDKPLHALLDACRTPYASLAPGTPAAHFAGKRPVWAETRPGCAMLSCSS